MQSTGHSSMQALSLRSTQGWAMTYVTCDPPRTDGARRRGTRPGCPPGPPLVSRTPYPSRTGRGALSGRVDPRLGPEHVGQRVVVRRRIGNGRVADVLVGLLAWDTCAHRHE